MNADAELIAKVLEGRATAEERARVLAEADRSPELLALLADSAAALGVDSDVIPLRPRRMSRSAMLGIGAAMVAAAGLFFMWPRGGGGGRSTEIPALPIPISINASDLGPARAGVPANALRGSSDGDRRQQSVIVGARITDYQVLGADTARETAALEIANALRSIPGGTVAASQFGPDGSMKGGAIAAVESVVDVPTFRAAQWMELVRLSASANDWRTLDRPDLRAGIAAISANESLPPTARRLAKLMTEQLASGRDRVVVSMMAGEALLALSRGD